MKPEELQNAIGDIGDDMIAAADEKKKVKGRSAVIATLSAAMAACILLTAILMPWNKIFPSKNIIGSGEDTAAADTTDNTVSTDKTDDTKPPVQYVPQNEYEGAEALSLCGYPVQEKFDILSGDYDPDEYDRYYEWKREIRARYKEYREDIGDISHFVDAGVEEYLGSADGKNLVFSPLNVYMALGLLAETCEGNSREQILSLLGERDMESLRENAKALWVGNYRDDGVVTSILGSAMWLDDSVAARSDLAKVISENYFASTYRGDMGTELFDSAVKAWLNEQTKGLLSEYTEGFKTTPETLMTVATTVYFKAGWDDEFSNKLTNEDIFYSSDGEITCEFMNETGSARYYEGENFCATAKNFRDGGDMWFILPDEGVEAESLFSDKEALEFINGKGRETLGEDFEDYRYLDLSVPKFDVSGSINLEKGLRELGVSDIFDSDKADFSPLTGDENTEVCVTDATHSARVKIDEEGCEAAATTLLLMGSGGMPDEIIDFKLDRPFIFVITSDVDLPLFVGIVNNP